MSDLIGKTLGPYRLLEQIGVGGMATVYKAYQPSMDRDVAIKILPHYLSQDAQFAKRFEREAHSIAKLEHPHILPVYDYGAHDGTTYIAMRYVRAGTLKERIARGPLPLEEIVRLIGEIGGALDYAHRQGIIHRDVKPGNVLIDAEGHTYLTDFGLAHMLEASQQLTASGVGVGTPAYMSPEQGQGVKVDQRSDIYSLGVILYEMVTGHVPFEAETPMAVVLKHITEPLPLPRAVMPAVPEAVQKVILKALAKDPAHRFQTAEEMVAALTAAHKSSASEPARPAAVDDAPSVTRVALGPQPKRSRSQWALVGSLIFIGVIGVIGLGVLVTQWANRAPTATPVMTAAPTLVATVTPVSIQAPAPTAAPIMENINAFAKPILQAIVDREPDFADDFSTADKGWNGGNIQPGESAVIQNGAARLTVNDKDVSFGNEALNRKDFALQVEARVAAGDKATQLIVNFHGLSSEYWFYVVINSAGNTWLVDKHTPGDQRNLAQGAGNVSPSGEMTRILIVARGPHAAIYLNETPVAYFEDADFDTSGGTGLFCQSLGKAVCEFDNVKFWDLANVPKLPETATLNPQAEQARAFAKPILQAIAGRQPDFADDFSNTGRGWEISSVDAGERAGDLGYRDGEYFIVVSPASLEHKIRHSFTSVPTRQVSDFVLEMDVRFILTQPSGGKSGAFYMHFPVGSAERYGLNLGLDGVVSLEKRTADQEFLILASIEGDPSRMYERQHLQIVVKGTQIAIFLGEQISFLVEDEALGSGNFNLGVWNSGSVALRAQVDNIKIWDISSLPTLSLSPQAEQARAFAEPILQIIANRKPDVADDFSAVDKTWLCGNDPLGATEACQVTNGAVRLTPAKGGFLDLSHPWMTAGSFVHRMDAREVSGSCASGFQFFAMGPERWSNLHLNPCQNEASVHVGYGGQSHPEREGSGGSVRPIGEVNHIEVIARGPRFAFYVNDVLVSYFEESHLDAVHEIGFRCNALPEMVCEFDNVKFWNLDNVPGLP